MAVRRYTREELHHLRASPLVQKPEDLPAIEQWIEYVYVYNGESREKLRIPHSEPQAPQQNASGNTRRQPQSKIGGDASPMGSFSTGVRPGLVTRTTGGRGGDEMSLGPPRTTFPSSRNTVRLSDFGDRATANTGDAALGDEQEMPRNRFSGERTNRKSVNDKDSWTLARERRALAGDDESRHDSRNIRGHREHHDGERKNGYGDKHDGRWNERRQNGDRPGGWRERQREKERDGDRPGPAEREPEWMDDPAPSNAEDDLRSMGMPRSQEQFQKWKEAMSGKKTQTEEPEAIQREQETSITETAALKPVAGLKLEGVVDKPFGSWGDSKPPGLTPDNPSTPGKSVPAKGRASRFASMFKESQPKEDIPPTEPVPMPAATGGANGSAEDEAGFKRILQMLGGTGISQAPATEVPTSPPTRALSNGGKQKSRFTPFFDQAPKSPEMPMSPHERTYSANNGDMFQAARGAIDEPGHAFGGMLQDGQAGERHARSRGSGNVTSPEPPMNGSRDQQAPPGRVNDIFLDQQPPSRNAATPDASIQNLLASQRAQKSQGQDKNSQFLLNLLQEKGGRPASQQQRSDFPLWLDQPPNMPPEPHAPKPRGAPPPPGFIDDQLLRNAPPEPLRQDHQQMQERRMAPRTQPNFFDEYNLPLQQQQQQRRNFTEPPQQPQQHQQPGPGRRPTGHPANHPQMQMQPQLPHQQFAGGPPPDFLQTPPPGFNPQMQRHPPGFHNFPTANMYQQPQQPQQQQQQQKPDHIPTGNFPGGIPGGPSGMGSGMTSPANVPPGFFAGGGPPGMPPPPPPGFMGIPAGLRDSAGRGGYEGPRYEPFEALQRR